MIPTRQSQPRRLLRGLGVVLVAACAAVVAWRLRADRMGLAAFLSFCALGAAAAVAEVLARERAEEASRAFLNSVRTDARTPALRSLLEQAGFQVRVVVRDAGWLLVPEPAGAGAEATAELDPRALASLSSSLRAELADALVSLDAARISSWIRRATEADPALGSALEQLAGEFRYTAILRALQRCDGDDANRAGGS